MRLGLYLGKQMSAVVVFVGREQLFRGYLSYITSLPMARRRAPRCSKPVGRAAVGPGPSTPDDGAATVSRGTGVATVAAGDGPLGRRGVERGSSVSAEVPLAAAAPRSAPRHRPRSRRARRRRIVPTVFTSRLMLCQQLTMTEVVRDICPG